MMSLSIDFISIEIQILANVLQPGLRRRWRPEAGLMVMINILIFFVTFLLFAFALPGGEVGLPDSITFNRIGFFLIALLLIGKSRNIVEIFQRFPWIFLSLGLIVFRSEERRVGKGCSAWWGWD